ncbi:restriction endonuclease subunit S [Lachnotalea glycerini]|uniref:Type I restriction modification DNA specificity domain-containing protein n=1 Tax=Lachnotalea glycerini TaxID=1763509 RepID=A0A371JBJ4_9FIRM|nr:restriction endonuclease subunit S [Lachnotalea glycerini]RDY30129.1 hypothetical protein CG710_016230 [Lachnotalea glycerini]
MSVIELSELTSKILTGMVVSRIENKKGVKKGALDVLTLKSISSGIIDKDQIQNIEISKQAADDKLTQYGDIIIKMNKPYDSVYIEREYTGMLIPSFCCLIRGIDKEIVDPYYLVGFLNSSFAKDYLYTSNSSSAASLLKIRDIKKLPVPLPELTEQQSIGNVFRLCSQRQLLFTKLKSQELKLAENIVMDSVREVFKIHEK